MNIAFAFIVVVVLALVPLVGIKLGLSVVFAVVIPYAAIAIFVAGVCYRVVRWARSPVPFRIPATCGQQKSLPWIKSSRLESPPNDLWMFGRMALEVLTFRSLFRNTNADLSDQRLSYGQNIWLWGAALAFHYSFLVVFLRHFRLFMEPVPFFVPLLQAVDGFFELSVPRLYVSGIVLILAVGYLFARRVVIPQIRYISLPADYFPLFLILGIAISGILMQQFWKVDIRAVKDLTAGLFSLKPMVPAGIGAMFYVHLFLVAVLIAYFPFSKLTHMAGVFMSPTRNQANDNRARRHVNPWNYPVKVHTYEEYEDEFRDLMKDAEMPLEKED